VDESEKTEDRGPRDEPEARDQLSTAAARDEVEPAAPVAAPVPTEDPAPTAAPSSIETSAPASIIDGQEHAVDPRSVTVARIVTILPILAIALGPLIGVTLGWAFGGIPSGVYLALLGGWLVLFGTALTFGYKWPDLHHRHLRYRVDETGVRIRRGVWWRKVISIPTSRVQHTDVSQGPVQRTFDLATLTVFTAGTEGASISLEGLEHGVAKRLRDHLLPDHHADAI
jgi:membrane protein YdbS with pleckstrin-like domain